ncbi:MAG: hypothetical protein B7X06_01125 [Verrucomicrobia bacterium 21-51-4]|nr:MAG: hypothetical protein B7X06_01125 [Verrucomicrobia bacterium 21-51-4]HQU08479.1 metal ABC transporter permease [Opitutales bacterium]
MTRSRAIGLVVMLLLIGAHPVYAAKISELDTTTVSTWATIVRFFSFQDEVVWYAVLGAICVGISSGILGAFLIVRRLAMVGDALSHAVLPGVVGGFIWAGYKNPWALFIGASIAGLVGTACINWIQGTTKIKQDTALGLVLSGFYGLGIVLLSMVQRLASGGKSGLDKFLFGQAAALDSNDLLLMALVMVLVVVSVIILYKEFVLISFDEHYAQASGVGARWIHGVMIVLVTFAIVSSLQACGIVLVSAMLVIPASTAYLMTQRMFSLIAVSTCVAIVSGIGGALISFLKPGLPTGPCIVLVSASFFTLAFSFSPKHGWVLRAWRRAHQRKRIATEHALKAMFHILEGHGKYAGAISLSEFAFDRRLSLRKTWQLLEGLRRRSMIYWSGVSEDEDLAARSFYMTPEGWTRSCEVVRNHRLWELYLTNAAHYPLDHVHDDAEKIEHILGDDLVRELEARLNYPQLDPHGKSIPGAGNLPNPVQK